MPPLKALKTDVSLHVVVDKDVHVSIDEDVNVDIDDVLNQIEDEVLQAALERRNSRAGKSGGTLTLIYEEFRRRGDAPEILRDYLYKMIGRIL